MSTKIIKVNNSYKTIRVGGAIIFDGAATVTSVNGQAGAVVLDQDDILDGTTYKQYSQTEKTKLAGIEAGSQVNTVISVAGKTGAVSLVKADVGLGSVVNADTTTTVNITDSLNKRFVTDAEKTKLSNTSGTNTGDQDLSPYFNKSSDDTDDITEGATKKFATAGEKTKLGHITVTQAVDLDQIESDTATNNTKVSNATHTGEVTGATSLTLDKTAITNKTAVTPATNDYILISDVSDSDNLKKALISDLPGGGSGVTDGDKGDITVSSGGTVWTIDNGVVTNDKQANVATATIKGRSTAGTGVVEDLSASQVRTITETETTTQLNTRDTNNRARANHTGTQTASTISDFDEAAQDATGAMVANSTFVNLTYNDATPSLTPALSATGTPSSSTFLRGDNTWATPAGSGDVSKVGTPVNNQVGVWTGDGTIEGDANLTFDTTTDTLSTVNIAASGDITVLDEAYGVSWNGSNEVPTKNALYDKIETLGGVTDGDKGDITVSASGATWNIDNQAVTYAKIQNVSATNRVLGRTTAGAGVVEEIATTGSGDVVRATSPTLVTPALGTPSALTLTNATGLPVAGIVSSTTQALGVGSLELGNASDTTLSRSTAGQIAVEGVAVPTISSTDTLTNKRITWRTGSATSSATPTINTDNVDYYELTAQAVDITSMTTNLSGTPTNGQRLWISITGTATRTITWGASFEASETALPTATNGTNRLDTLFVWNASTSRWRIVSSNNGVVAGITRGQVLALAQNIILT